MNFTVPDIDRLIIFSNHPYYNYNLRKVNKYYRTLFENSKYELLQVWCWPNEKIKDIRSRLPNITMSDVVELSLVYYPIPESINYYDKLTLFYHACKQGQSHPEGYLKSLQFIVYCISFICYKFDRWDILQRLSVNQDICGNYREAFMELLSLRNNDKFECLFSQVEITAIENYSMLFTIEQTFELCLLSIGGEARDYLTNYNHINNSIANVINPLVTIIGINKCEQIARKYDPKFTIVNRDYSQFNSRYYINSIISMHVGKEISAVKLVLEEGLAEREIDFKDLGDFYVRCGKFDLYSQWRKSGLSISPKRYIDQQHSIVNIYNKESYNKDLYPNNFLEDND